jgi:hypothetical protein
VDWFYLQWRGANTHNHLKERVRGEGMTPDELRLQPAERLERHQTLDPGVGDVRSSARPGVKVTLAST